ncbi:MAG: aminopeptidase P family protein [Oscillospiraceae bacterium]|nr:aminopeptidase P family protein [Oscillospiraceae bacterium]MDD4369261.1 aminopeptidase P family protein [Oscillospiraceae bacterium]
MIKPESVANHQTNTRTKLAQLREFMQAQGVSAYVILSSDPHMSEYLPERWQTRSYMSGFSGSAGNLVVLPQESALWTDGRYFIQAERQLAGSGIKLMRLGEPGIPSLQRYLAEQLPPAALIGLEGEVVSQGMVRSIEAAGQARGLRVRDLPFPASLWPDRPDRPATPVWPLPAVAAGVRARDKIRQLRDRLAELGSNSMLVTRLDDVAWLTNLRAADIAYNPFLLAYCWVNPDGCTLYTDPTRVNDAARQQLKQEGISLKDYTDVMTDLAACRRQQALLLDPAATNHACFKLASQNPALTLVEADDPIQLLKAVKSPEEIANLHRAHVLDGVAMVRFQMALENKLHQGATLTEADAAELADHCRRAVPGNIGLSFNTIAAYGANAAMMHYAPHKETAADLRPGAMLLVDSGGQYDCGTTDITRTYAIGEPTAEQIDYYTLTLEAHINMAMTVFPAGCSGANLDIMSRQVFWQRGLDYRCGTGHGVGYIGGVHEGPHSLRTSNYVPFRPGMVVTDEPGYYEEGNLGVRIENELLCVEKEVTEYGRYLAFEALTYCPYDTSLIEVGRLTPQQLDWLNQYHATVWEILSPHLGEVEQAWLKAKCRPLSA